MISGFLLIGSFWIYNTDNVTNFQYFTKKLRSNGSTKLPMSLFFTENCQAETNYEENSSNNDVRNEFTSENLSTTIADRSTTVSETINVNSKYSNDDF